MPDRPTENPLRDSHRDTRSGAGGGPRRRAAARDAALAVLLAVGATLILMYPVSLHPAALGRTDSTDGRFSIWNVAWVAHALLSDPRHLYDANIFYPHQDTLAYSEANIGAGALAVPGYALTHDPYVAYNSAVLLMFVLSTLVTFSLVRRLTGSPGAAAVAGICFAFCPYVLSNTAEIQLMMTVGFPLTMIAFHRQADRPTVARGVATGLAVGLTALFCAYYGVFAGLMVAWAAVVIAFTRARWRNVRYWISFAVAAAVSVGFVLPFFLPYAGLRRGLEAVRPLRETIQFSANWQAYLASGARAHRWMHPYIQGWEDVLFPGFVVTALAVFGVFAVLRARRPPAANPTGPRAQPDPAVEGVLLYGSMAVVAFWLSFGPRGGLYSVVSAVVPVVFGLLRAPSRAGVVVTFALAVLAGFGVAALQRRTSRPSLLAAGLCLLAALDVAAVPVPASPNPPMPSIYHSVKGLPPGPVLELPMFWRRDQWPRNTLYMLFSTAHWKPLVGGYSDYVPPEFRSMSETLSEFPTPASFVVLHRLGVRYVVFHPALYFDDASRAALVRKLAAYHDEVRLALRTADAWLYEIVAWPPETPDAGGGH
jgi:hypothetical protein